MKGTLPRVITFTVLWVFVGFPQIRSAGQGPSNPPAAARQRLEKSVADWGVYGEGVWLSRWHGVAPTAWCYFANTTPVFSQGLIRGTVLGGMQS